MKNIIINQHGVVCVGILCADILGKTIDEIPGKGKLGLVDNINLELGGCAANVAISLAKLGMRPHIVGKVGDDSLGSYAKKALTREHVNIDGLHTDPSVPTAASMVMIAGDGERTILHSLGANQHFTFDDIDLDIVRKSRIMLIAGTFLMPSFDGDGTKSLLRYAQHHGVLTCMDTAWDASGKWMKTIGDALPYLDWFMPSYDEAVCITGEREPAVIADILIENGVKNVIIKLDASGCFLKAADKYGEIIPAYDKIRAVDASGAGDSFCAGFIAGLAQGWDLKLCAHFANAVGAHCVREIGTTTGIRPMDEILVFMNNYRRENAID